MKIKWDTLKCLLQTWALSRISVKLLLCMCIHIVPNVSLNTELPAYCTVLGIWWVLSPCALNGLYTETVLIIYSTYMVNGPGVGWPVLERVSTRGVEAEGSGLSPKDFLDFRRRLKQLLPRAGLGNFQVPRMKEEKILSSE